MDTKLNGIEPNPAAHTAPNRKKRGLDVRSGIPERSLLDTDTSDTGARGCDFSSGDSSSKSST